MPMDPYGVSLFEIARRQQGLLIINKDTPNTVSVRAGCHRPAGCTCVWSKWGKEWHKGDDVPKCPIDHEARRINGESVPGETRTGE